MTMPAPGPLVVCLLGAPGSLPAGLARELQSTLAARFGLRCTRVDEGLDALFKRHPGRPPSPSELAGQAADHAQRLATAVSGTGPQPPCDLVVCVGSPVLTAACSEHFHADRRLYASAVAWHRQVALTLLITPDRLPDGAADTLLDASHDAPQHAPHGAPMDTRFDTPGDTAVGSAARRQIDRFVRQALLGAGLGWSRLSGGDAARLAQALAALRAVLPGLTTTGPDTAAGNGINEGCAGDRPSPWRHLCAHCGDGDCERRLFRRALAAPPGRHSSLTGH
ncbi:MAG: hypothetical protein RIQ60_3535 [Pseudomonadota bacterium]|jgi:hypothetical protein